MHSKPVTFSSVMLPCPNMMSKHPCAFPVLAIHILLENGLFINAQMIVAISTRKPSERVCLPSLLQMLRHLATGERLRADEIQEHLGLVYHCKDRCYGADLPRHELVVASFVRQAGDAQKIEQDKER